MGLKNRILIIVASVCTVVFLFYMGFTAVLVDRKMGKLYLDRGLAALQTVASLLEVVTTQSATQEELEKVMSQLLDNWGASYVVYPSLSSDRAYVTTHKFGTILVERDVISAVLQRGRRELWSTTNRFVRQEGESRIMLQELPVVGEYYDFSKPVLQPSDFTLHIGFSRKYLLGRVRLRFLQDVGLIALILLAGLALFYWLLSLFFRHLDRLFEYGRQLSRREFTAPSSIRGGDECAAIAGALESIVRELNTSSDAFAELSSSEGAGGKDLDRWVAALHGLLDLSPHGIAVAAPSGEILLVNQPFCRLLGRLESSILGIPLRELEFPTLRPLIERAIEEPNHPQEGEIELPFERRGRLIVKGLDDQGGVGVVVQEITAMRDPEELVEERVAIFWKEVRDRGVMIEELLPAIRRQYEGVAAAIGPLQSLEEGEAILKGIEATARRSHPFLHPFEPPSLEGE